MKKLLGLIVIVVVAMLWLFRNAPPGTDLNRPIQPAVAPTPTPSPSPTPSATPSPTSPPVATMAARTPPPRPTLDDRLQRMQRLAPQAGVQLTGYQPQAGGAWLEVGWGGDVTTLGADYLELLMREGVIRDFDVNRTSLNATMQGGRRTWIGRYFVLF
jgi:hypothetical protein